MKKMFRKVLVTALTVAMALGTVVAINPSSVKADEVVADFSLADADWTPSVWGAGDDGSQAGASTTINGAGSYSMTIDTSAAAAEGATVFVIDIPFGADALKAQNYAVSELKLTVDDAEFAIDTSKIVVGDIEEKGNLRIELYNAYGPTAVNQAYDATVSPFDPATLKSNKSIKVDFTLVESEEPAYDADGKALKYVGVNGAAAGGEDVEPIPEFDSSAKYNAYIGFQTPSYSFRNEWYEPNYGLGTDYFNQATGWENDAAVQKQGTISDVVIDGNGTYRVSITDLGSWMADEINASTDGIFNCLFISTDIPVDADVEITNVKLIVDGSTKHTDKVAFLNPDAKDYINILIQNIWNDEKAAISYYAAPTKSLEMEFTISGFDYDNASQKADVDTNADANANTDDNAKKGGIDPIVVAVIVVVVVAVVAAVVVVSKKNKKKN